MIEGLIGGLQTRLLCLSNGKTHVMQLLPVLQL